MQQCIELDWIVGHWLFHRALCSFLPPPGTASRNHPPPSMVPRQEPRGAHPALPRPGSSQASCRRQFQGRCHRSVGRGTVSETGEAQCQGPSVAWWRCDAMKPCVFYNGEMSTRRLYRALSHKCHHMSHTPTYWYYPHVMVEKNTCLRYYRT